MPRIPLTEKSVLKMVYDLSSGDKLSVLYPITLSIGLAGSPSEIRKHLEKLSDKGIVILKRNSFWFSPTSQIDWWNSMIRYKSKIPFAHKIIGYGYHLPCEE